jgi:hypothetical protein
VQHDEDGGGKVRIQSAQQLLDGFEPSAGASDGDDLHSSAGMA